MNTFCAIIDGFTPAMVVKPEILRKSPDLSLCFLTGAAGQLGDILNRQQPNARYIRLLIFFLGSPLQKYNFGFFCVIQSI